MTRSADDDYMQAVLRLRHAAFALHGSASSLEVADRQMAEDHLIKSALALTKYHRAKFRPTKEEDQDAEE